MITRDITRSRLCATTSRRRSLTCMPRDARGPIEEREYGRVVMIIVPGADDIQLYQPTHKLAYNL